MQVARTIETPLTPSNGHETAAKMHDSLHLPERLPLRMAWRERLRKAWAHLVVAKNVEGKYTISAFGAVHLRRDAKPVSDLQHYLMENLHTLRPKQAEAKVAEMIGLLRELEEKFKF